MGKIFYIMGKSASGKDTLYKCLMEKYEDRLKNIIGYTTRPIREGEKDGVEYFFTTEDVVKKLDEEGKIIELREYQTMVGPWKYFTANDGQIDLEKNDYLLIGTLQSYLSMREYFGQEYLIPIYIELDDGKRLTRALNREKNQKKPNYAELCRRYLADDADFSEEKLLEAGITRRFENDNLEDTIHSILEYMNL